MFASFFSATTYAASDFCMQWSPFNSTQKPCGGDITKSSITTIPGSSAEIPLSIVGTGTDTTIVSLITVSSDSNITTVLGPDTCTNVGNGSSCEVRLTLTALENTIPGVYTVTVRATDKSAPPIIRTISTMVMVGSSSRFSFSLSPAIMQINKPGQINTQVNVSLLHTPTEPISFSVQNENNTYVLPNGISAQLTSPSCTPDEVTKTCVSPPQVTFTINSTVADGDYMIPLLGQNSVMKRVYYLSLKVGSLNLKAEKSNPFITEAHARPYAHFTWTPPVPFVGDSVTFDAHSSTIWDNSVQKMIPVTIDNAIQKWTFNNDNNTVRGTDLTLLQTFSTSDTQMPKLTLIEKNFSSLCFANNATNTAQTVACQCEATVRLTENKGINHTFVPMNEEGIAVAKSRPFFREKRP